MIAARCFIVGRAYSRERERETNRPALYGHGLREIDITPFHRRNPLFSVRGTLSLPLSPSLPLPRYAPSRDRNYRPLSLSIELLINAV